MEFSSCRVICFSPTGGSKKIAEAAATATGLPVQVSDMTLPAARQETLELQPEELVFISVPVYFGRVSKTAAGMIAGLRGKGKYVVLMVSYGNREFDDALLELLYLVRGSGFTPLAAGAFAAEHSFCTAEYPLAKGRPDAADLTDAQNFGKEIAAKMAAGTLEKLKKVPGTAPYKPYPDAHRAPNSLENCTLCGTCVAACPVGAITIEEGVLSTDEQACIMCQACVKVCPEQARVDNGPGALETKQKLTGLTAARKEAQTFFAV